MIPRYSHPEMARVWSEQNKLQKWLQVEIAVCEAWARIGAIPPEDMDRIRGATVDQARMEELFRETHHDIISFVRAVAEKLGPSGRFVHLGLTSSDVLDTALALQVREACSIIRSDLESLEQVLTRMALQYKRTPMIGRTHGVHAEPTTFGHKLAVWVAEVRRHRRRLQTAAEEMAVGKIAGAVGTHANVPPEVEEDVCRQLGLSVAEAATQIVQRDRHAHLVTTLAGIAASLEKFALEIRLLQRTEVGEVAEPFEPGQQGSSAMPHKRNPELCERVCGLARVVRAYATPALEDVALWHERDISHSSVERIILPDAFLALDYMLRTFTYIMDKLEVREDQMRRNLEATRGLIYSGRVLLALVERGMDRAEAYKLIQGCAMRVWQGEPTLLDLLRSEPRVTQLLGYKELEDLFDLGYHLRYIDETYSRLGLTA